MPGLESSHGERACTVASLMRDFTQLLTGAGIEGAAGDVRRLAAAALAVSSTDVLRAPERVPTSAQLEVLRGYVERRRRHEPVSRILGEREFYGRSFAISPATLDPRPDSETLIATVLDIVREEGWLDRPLRIVDIGTGTGCLLLTLLCELPKAGGLGTDISETALKVAAHNACRLGLEQRTSWQQADGLESVIGPFHILIANPPYVRTADIADLAPEVRNYDPISALDGGPDGLEIYRRMLPSVTKVVPSGWIVLEVGYDQADAVVALITSQVPGADETRTSIRHDVAGKRRCVAVRTLT